MDVPEIQSIVAELRAQGRLSSSVTVREVHDPFNEPHQDYYIVYELHIEPKSPDMACLEVGLTDDGYVSLIFERAERIAARLNLKIYQSFGGFIMGHEPAMLTKPMLALLMNNMALGRFVVVVRQMFGIGLKARLFMPYSDLLLLDEWKYGYADRFIDIPDESGALASTSMRKVLRYRPWAEGVA